MPARKTGRYEIATLGGEDVGAFIPHGLPPADPPITLDPLLTARLQGAEQALRRLELAGAMVPSMEWFIYAFVRKEAVLSAQIEGTQATLLDLLSFEAGEHAGEASPSADVEDVCNYLEALDHARRQLASSSGRPLSMRLLHETHRILLRGARGARKLPGEVRRSQNWIGGTRPGNAHFVPPPAHALHALLSDLERYLHTGNTLPPLLRIGLVHVQFETIHPYLDGNGRIGRLLITLLLEQWGLLSAPLLYLSLHFKRFRPAYYERLDAVRREGDWEGWLLFFLEGVALIADEATTTARDLFTLVAQDRSRLLETDSVNLLALQVFEQLPRHPILSTSWVVETFGSTKPTAGRAIGALERAGVLVETTGRKRDRVYTYATYLELLASGTELAGS